MKTKYRCIVILLLLAATTETAKADGFNYDYLQITHDKIRLDLDDETIRGDGPSISASINIASRFFLTASYNHWNLELDALSVDADIERLGLGYHVTFRPNTDLIFVLTAIKIKLRADTASRQRSGISDTFWVRHRLNDKFEVGGRLGFTNNEYSIDAIYNFKKRWALILTLESNDEFDTTSLGLRYYFRKPQQTAKH